MQKGISNDSSYSRISPRLFAQFLRKTLFAQPISIHHFMKYALPATLRDQLIRRSVRQLERKVSARCFDRVLVEASLPFPYGSPSFSSKAPIFPCAIVFRSPRAPALSAVISFMIIHRESMGRRCSPYLLHPKRNVSPFRIKILSCKLLFISRWFPRRVA